MTRQINWGIIGAGNVCEIKSGPAFNKVPDSKLVAVMRRTPGMARGYALRHGVPKFYEDATPLISDQEINAIYIATPPAFHEQYALQAIKAGKPVYIEKPVTLNASGCKNLIDAAHTHNVRVTVAHYRRRLPLFIKIKELVDAGILGNIKNITINMQQSPAKNIIANTDSYWRVQPELSGGGLFHDLAPHQLDIIYWLFNEPLTFSGRSLNKGKYYSAPDFCELNATFYNNVTFKGTWDFNARKSDINDHCKITGSKGYLSFSFFRNPTLRLNTNQGIETYNLPYPKHVQQPMIADVVQYFKGKNANPCSLEDAFCTMRMMDITNNYS